MLPDGPRTLHLASEHVVIDGAPRPATLVLEEDDDARRGARVTSIEPYRLGGGVVDAGASLVAPAPLDLHFHGAGGHVVPPGGSAAAIDEALAGAFGDAPYEWVATLPIPATPPHDPVTHVAGCAAALAAAGEGGTGCVGIRIEGLFLNPSRAGVWPPETFVAPDLGLLDELDAAARDAGSRLLVVDVAPELPGALALVERLAELGIVASLAHTDATYEQARAAMDAGATLATHTWNAMRPVAHRDPGVVAAVLADPRVTCELICDGVHLHPGTIALSTAACGAGRWIAVSDASPFAGCAPGPYDWAGTTVHHDGVALRDDAGHLAGSASLLDAALPVLAAAGTTPLDALLAVGADPRRVLDPTRPRGLRLGDPVWVVDPGAAG
jgi:N-acetylglucosamine-6-phosphate deacetylase